MKIDLTELFNGSKERIDIECLIDLKNLEYNTYYPLKKPVNVSGSLTSKADVVYLDLKVDYTFEGFCDRCAEELVKNYVLSIHRIVVEQLQNENNDDEYLIVENRTLDIEEFINEEVLLSLPSKILCSDDCKGICSQCGVNLNVNKCNCKKAVDPRMEALLQLLDEE